MASLSAFLLVPLLFAVIWALYSAYYLLVYYRLAAQVGVPLRLLPISHGNPFWMMLGRKLLHIIKPALPTWINNTNFFRYNWRGWEVHDRSRSHLEMGDVWMHVTPAFRYALANGATSLTRMMLTGEEMLNVFGPNVSTVDGQQWKKQRKITAACFNEQTNQVVWSESISQASDMIRYWSSMSEVRTTADDVRTLSLHVLSRAGFGKSFPFQGQQARQTVPESIRTDSGTNYKSSLQMVLDNCVLIMALGTQFLAKPWLPERLRNVHKACVAFQQYMADTYEQEKRSGKNKSAGGKEIDSNNLMTALVRASQSENETQSSSTGGLTEREIYGNMFVFNFAGHDTTAHTLTFIFYFLATAPDVQEWITEEIDNVLGERWPRPDKWDYNKDYPRLKRCLSVLMETVRLYTPVPVAKWTGSEYRTLEVNGKVITIPPETMVLPSYSALHTHPKFWGQNSLEWKPSRWITTSSDRDEEILVPERGTFIGWSEGERSCPGKRFTQVETVATLAAIFGGWKVEPAKLRGESIEDARRRVLHQIETDSHVVLLLQMLRPERAPLVWKKRA